MNLSERIDYKTTDSECARNVRTILDGLPDVNYRYARYQRQDGSFEFEFEVAGAALIEQIAMQKLIEN